MNERLVHILYFLPLFVLVVSDFSCAAVCMTNSQPGIAITAAGIGFLFSILFVMYLFFPIYRIIQNKEMTKGYFSPYKSRVHTLAYIISGTIAMTLMCAVCAPMPDEDETTLDILYSPLKGAAIGSSIIFMFVIVVNMIYCIILDKRLENIRRDQRPHGYSKTNDTEIIIPLTSDTDNFEIGDVEDDHTK